MNTPRALVLGSSATLAATVEYLRATGTVEIAGVLTDSHDPGLDPCDGKLPVAGSFQDLLGILAGQSIDLIILSAVTAQNTAQILRDAERFAIPVRILPTADDLLLERVRVTRTVTKEEIEQQLSGTSISTVETPHPLVIEAFRERTLLITGAAGSIGAELTRQAAQFPISGMVLLDHDENALVELSDDLRRHASNCKISPVIGDIRNPELLRDTFARYSPDIVLHAAAYKHVPVLEHNVCEAVLNNVMGTRLVTEAALDAGCERFVLISTDKAVHSSSVMGATKRVAELVVQKLAQQCAEANHANKVQPHFACVRFVNVLGSRGSVTPIFLRQIASGGPLTVTHEEMRRYFMTIEQASQLVLEASSLASAGEIFMLEMGDPIRIIDFARDLVRMSGLEPGRDIGLELTGIRPGEKLREQLSAAGETLLTTALPYIFQVRTGAVPSGFVRQLAALESAAIRQDADEVLQLLTQMPIDYHPLTDVSSNAASRG